MEDNIKSKHIGAKRSQKKYDISDYTFPIPDFMSDIELKDMYKSLTFHMKMKYGVYDEETIHRTIIRGLHKADMYDSKKASKLVWFQSILYFYWIQEKSSKYNPGVNDLSLSTSLSKEDPDFLVIDILDGGDDSWLSYAETENDTHKEKASGWIHDIIIAGEYPYLQMRCMGFTYRDIQANSTGEVPCYPTISSRIHNERERLKEELKDIKEIQVALEDRVPVWMWTPKASKKKAKEEFNCRNCSTLFIRIAGGGSKLYCSADCRKRWKATYNKVSIFQCKWCKKDFKKASRKGCSRTYCSKVCKSNYISEYQKMVYRKKTENI